ncbi:MaoC-like protein [Aeromicrobium marinum DSM 15272]|uniref:MaoC-like protein n=1 Tax=Aeromicrobium marinum DSM 15272 TaxID=585531 RepID=E2SD99_9ACTN|nr:MaoC-like protein [Aeromicrobium marinum DSM 15272]
MRSVATVTPTTASDSPLIDDFDVDQIGVWGDPSTTEVTGDQIAAYAAATNDPHPWHLSGRQAPIVFAVVPTFTLMAERAMAPVPDHLMLRILHGEQDIRSHRPIVAGDRLTSRSRVVGIHGKSSGVVVTTAIETVDDTGAPVVSQSFAGFFRGGRWEPDAGEAFPEHALSPRVSARPADFVVQQRIDPDQTHRYAAASGDPMPIHTDDEFARAMGLPGIIAHGLCTMAFTSVGLVETVCPADPGRLSRLAVRFAGIARPGDQLSTRYFDLGAAGSDAAFGFTTMCGDDPVITDGLAVVRGQEAST